MVSLIEDNTLTSVARHQQPEIWLAVVEREGGGFEVLGVDHGTVLQEYADAFGVSPHGSAMERRLTRPPFGKEEAKERKGESPTPRAVKRSDTCRTRERHET